MDHSAWMGQYTAPQAYSHLSRVPGNPQINSGSHPHQFPHNGNLSQLNYDHMAAFNVANCPKNIGSTKNPKHVNQISSNPLNHNTGQPLMNCHYNAASNRFLNPHQQHYENSLQVRNHPERGNPSLDPSNHFAIQNGVYDSNFMSTSFQQQSNSNYLPSMTATSGCMKNVKKPDAEMNFSSNPYPNMNGFNMAGMSAHGNALRASNLSSGPLYPKHPLASSTAYSAWHHQNIHSSNGGMMQHDSANMIQTPNMSTCLRQGCSRSSCSNPNGNSLSLNPSKISCNMAKPNQPECNLNAIQYKNSQYNPAAAVPFPKMPSNNPYFVQNFSQSHSGQNSLGDPLGAKFVTHRQVASDYASLAFAAASEYAFQQQQQVQKHQYMSSMNNYTSNQANHLSNYSSMPFDTNNFNYGFPMAHAKTMNPNLKSHNSPIECVNYFNGNLPNNLPANTQTKTKTKQKRQQQNYKSESASANMLKSSDLSTSSNCSNFSSTNPSNYLMNVPNNGIGSSNNISRCPSVASNHQMPHSNDSYSYNPSPANTNFSAHSPYQQRSSTSNSSHSSGASCAINNNEYLNYGTPNSVPATPVFPLNGNSQTPTPTPGYPTPPSSVGHSNSRCNSNEELSPYSNNSSQPFSCSTEYKSSSSCSSQISPKLDNGFTDALSFNSACMITSQKGAIPSENMNSTDMYDSTDHSYKSSPQFPVDSYQNHHNTSAPSSTCSNDLYMNYSAENSSIHMRHQDSLVIANNNDPAVINNQNFEYDQSENLPSCAQQMSKSCARSSDNQLIGDNQLIESIEESKPEYEGSHENFNMNFDSVIQPIDNLSNQQENQINELSTSSTENIEQNCMSSIASDKSVFPSIDDLTFISSQEQDGNHCTLNEKHDNYSMAHSMGNSDQISTIEQCDPLDFQSSQSNHLIENSSIDCNNIQSLIDSLPKPGHDCLQLNKSGSSELLSHCSTTDNCLSDLALLMNDNSKLALMESLTFKSNHMPIEHEKDLVINGAPFGKIKKDIFEEHPDLKMHPSIDFAKQELSDVDEFLQSNLSIVPTPAETENEHKIPSPLSSDSTQSDQKDLVEVSLNASPSCSAADKKLEVLQNEVKDNSSEATNKSGQNKSFKRKSDELPLEQNNDASKKQRKVAKVKPQSKECKKPQNEIIKNGLGLLDGVTKHKNSSKKTSEGKHGKQLSKMHSKGDTIFSKKKVINDTVSFNKESKGSHKSSQDKKSIEVLPKVSKSKAKSDNLVDKLAVKLTANSKLQPLTVDTSPSSLSDAKENVATINTSTVTKSKSSHSNSVKTNQLNLTSSHKSSGKKKSDKSTSSDNVVKVSVPECPKIAKPNHPKPVNSQNNKPKVGTIKGQTKNAAISPKTCVSTTSGSLLPQANLINSTCINKPVSSTNFNLTSPTNATLSNVAPTLIVNQNPPVNSYQVSPMTNAVLISIHPANTAPISSLTAPSTFITLSNQSVSSSSNNTTTTTSGSTQSSSSRRRSQDKKVATVREGLMRTGDFVVAEEEAQLPLPVIWRIEGKSLLQRFEPSEQNGITVYTNTSSYSAWNPTVRQKYLGLDVRIMGCNRTRIVVEKLGLTQTKCPEISEISQIEKDSSSLAAETLSPADISQHLENFEVFMQTMISQALDSNFIAEIIEDNDEYFLTHIKIIDEICSRRRAHFISKTKWEATLLKSIEAFPEIQINNQNDVGDLRCRLCHDNWSTKILHFEGSQYNPETLEVITESDVKPTKLASCDACTDKTFLYSRLHHQKYNCYLSCKSKVDAILSKDDSKQSHEILEDCLKESDWIQKLFNEFESLLVSCDNIR